MPLSWGGAIFVQQVEVVCSIAGDNDMVRECGFAASNLTDEEVVVCEQ